MHFALICTRLAQEMRENCRFARKVNLNSA